MMKACGCTISRRQAEALKNQLAYGVVERRGMLLASSGRTSSDIKNFRGRPQYTAEWQSGLLEAFLRVRALGHWDGGGGHFRAGHSAHPLQYFRAMQTIFGD